MAALLAGCASAPILMEKQDYSPDHPKYAIGVDKHGRKNGLETWWHPNGLKKYQAENRDGVRDGKYTAWYPDGIIWYEGYDFRGIPESTLTYWSPNGKIKSKVMFRNGIQLERSDYDDNGNLIGANPALPASPVQNENGDETARLRKASLDIWAMRVRQTVESFWVLPKQFEKDRPYRSVATIKVGKDGRILGVKWIEKSPSAAFNTLAQLTFKRIKRLPAFPPQVKDESLEIQYEFISLGKPAPRRKLEARDTPEEK
ncbi:MAG: TonB C-terminal domain-containing protein [Fibrobacteria bacterium]